MKNKYIQIRIDKAEKEAIQLAAKRRCISTSALVSIALHEFLRDKPELDMDTHSHPTPGTRTIL